MQSRDLAYSVKIIELGKDSSESNTNSSYEADDQELNEIVQLASAHEKELEMLTFLVLSPLRRAEKRQDKLCREFYNCIK
jgi:hypothetical protein